MVVRAQRVGVVPFLTLYMTIIIIARRTRTRVDHGPTAPVRVVAAAATNRHPWCL
jgi:hypothetical protein